MSTKHVLTSNGMMLYLASTLVVLQRINQRAANGTTASVGGERFRKGQRPTGPKVQGRAYEVRAKVEVELRDKLVQRNTEDVTARGTSADMSITERNSRATFWDF